MGSTRIRWARPAVAIAGVIGLSASAASGAAASTAAASASSGWRVVVTANAAFDTAIAPTRTSVWALGSVFPPGGIGKPALRPTGLHWNGHSWSHVAFPSSVKSGIGCAAASSAGNVWAFAGTTLTGDSAQYAGALHLVRGKWQVSKTFSPAGLISGCSVLGNGNAWAYGLTHVAPGAGTWRLRGRTWSRATTGNFFLVTASEVRPTDGGAIAADSIGSNDVVAHWNGRTWTRQSGLAKVLPGLGRTVDPGFQQIHAVGGGNFWVAGQLITLSNSKVSNIVLHLIGGKWYKVARGSAGYYLPTAVPDGRGGWWASQLFATPQSAPSLLHEAKGKSSWVRVALPKPKGGPGRVTGLVHLPDSTATLALVSIFTSTGAPRTEIMASGTLPK